MSEFGFSHFGERHRRYFSSARKSASEMITLSAWRLWLRRWRSPETIHCAWAAIAHSKMRLSGSSFNT